MACCSVSFALQAAMIIDSSDEEEEMDVDQQEVRLHPAHPTCNSFSGHARAVFRELSSEHALA